MAHWAKIDDSGLVVQVTVGSNDESDEGYDWLMENIGGTWLKTSYNTYGGVHYTDGEPSTDQSKAFRYNYAGIGYTFEPDLGTDGAFIPPSPYPSWLLHADTCLWQAPIPYPADGAVYSWDETSGDWVEIVEPSE